MTWTGNLVARAIGAWHRRVARGRSVVAPRIGGDVRAAFRCLEPDDLDHEIDRGRRTNVRHADIAGSHAVVNGLERRDVEGLAVRAQQAELVIRRARTVRVVKLPRFGGHPKTGVSDAEEAPTTATVLT